MLIYIIISSLIIMLASLIGAISVWKNFGKIIEKNLHFLVSFSAGVFIIIAYELAKEAIELGGLLWIFIGAIMSYLIFKFMPSFHHHHENNTDHAHNNIDAGRVIVSDGIHNIGDGILLVASFSISATLGFTTAISVFIHELIQEISEFFVLKQAGFNTKKALILNFFTSGSILIGSIGGYFLLETFESIEGLLLGISSGSFLIIVFHDLIPHSLNSINSTYSNKHTLKHIAWFILGAIMISISNYAIPHIH